ncbi:hypothetical protein D3C77_209780 [compost metagenome]
MGDVIDTLRLECFGERLAMVDHLVGAQLTDPFLGLWTRGGTDHGEPGQLAGQLGQDRADATGGADDQQTLARILLPFSNLQALEQQFPGGDRRQRQGGGLSETQGPGHMANDALVDHMQLTVGSGPGDGACVINLVAWLKQADLAAHRLDHTGHIPTQHLGDASFRLHVLADFGIHRVDGNGPHFYQQVPWPWLRGWQFDVLQGGRVGNGQGMVVGDGFHVWGPQG